MSCATESDDFIARVVCSSASSASVTDTELPGAFVQDVRDSIEFARGDPDSTWDSVRAAVGHPKPYEPDIPIISNCDGSSHQLDHPAHLYDFHIYTSANNMFSGAHQFDRTKRTSKDSLIIVSTHQSSPFSRIKVALRMDVLCDNEGSNICPPGEVITQQNGVLESSFI